ncbi:hypothetical protein SAY87_029532 [Trapa incisa]|uniref:C2 domain-containing protein n=1 Tax=Trapa incisa TaxID=236973 RepID=A0AAN7KBV4_9MYRT|nr:hypothetical protein SAY87_029532 [Trapa incisa]
MQSVEITVISAENLRVGKKPVKKSSFVAVRASSASECCTTKMSAEGGGSHPTWNEKLAVDLQPADLRNGFIMVEVYCKVTSSKSKLVGGVHVPVSDFLGGFLPSNRLQFLSYRLWDPTFERNGVVNISVKVRFPETPNGCRSFPQAPRPKAIVGVPAREQERERLGGVAVVAGVPAVWFGRSHCTYQGLGF